MDLKVSVTDLESALGKILSIVDKKNTRQILTYCLLTSKNKSLEIIASDLEVTAKVIIPCESAQDFSYCLNPKTLFDIVRELPKSTLLFEKKSDNNNLKLTCENINYSLLVFESKDFPQFTFNNSEQSLKINSNFIQEIVNKTSHAISSDETRPEMNGLFLQSLDSKLRAVSTDGHRLALVNAEVDLNDNDYLTNGLLIPKKGVYELRKIADSNLDKDINIHFDDSFLYVSTENTFLSIRLIAKDFPKYQSIIPSKTSFQINFEKELLVNAIKRIKIMSSERSNAIKFIVTNNSVSLIANHPSLGHAKEVIDITYDGEELEIGLNAKYLLDVLSIIDEDEVTLEINNELSPFIIKSIQNPNFLGLIMPLRL